MEFLTEVLAQSLVWWRNKPNCTFTIPVFPYVEASPLEGRRFITLQKLEINLLTQEAPEAHKIHKPSPPTHFHPRVIQVITTAKEEAPAGSTTYKLCRELTECSFHDSSPTLGWGSQWYGCLSHQCCYK